MREPRNRVVQVRGFGGPDELEVVDAPLPTAGRGRGVCPHLSYSSTPPLLCRCVRDTRRLRHFFLAASLASWSAAFGGLDRLAVNDTSRGAGFAASGLARLQQQSKLIRSNKPLSRSRNSLAPP